MTCRFCQAGHDISNSISCCSNHRWCYEMFCQAYDQNSHKLKGIRCPICNSVCKKNKIANVLYGCKDSPKREKFFIKFSTGSDPIYFVEFKPTPYKEKERTEKFLSIIDTVGHTKIEEYTARKRSSCENCKKNEDAMGNVKLESLALRKACSEIINPHIKKCEECLTFVNKFSELKNQYLNNNVESYNRKIIGKKLVELDKLLEDTRRRRLRILQILSKIEQR